MKTYPCPRTAAAVVPVLAWTVHALVMRRRLELARRDPLTGLRTRAGWSQLAQQMLRTQHGDQVAVLLLDLDGFKAVNDTYGHATGDELLTAVAARLASWCGPREVAGRLGGDEFVAAIRLGTTGARLRQRIEDLHTVIGMPLDTHRAGRLCPSASIGVASTHDHIGADLPRLLERADAAMYVAKVAGVGVHLADEHLPEARTVNGRREGRLGASTPSQMEVAA